MEKHRSVLYGADFLFCIDKISFAWYNEVIKGVRYGF